MDLLSDLGSSHQWALLSIALGITLTLSIFVFARHRAAAPPRSAPAHSDPDSGPQPTPATHDPFVHGSASEQRSALRRRGTLVHVVVADSATRDRTWSATITDRSVGG